MSVSRDTALEILSVARAACGHWSRPVVVAGELSAPTMLSFSCDDGATRFAGVEMVERVKGGPARDGERVTPRVADEMVQLAVFGEVRYPV